MKNALKFLLTIRLKHIHSHQTDRGFTLIELLVALLLAFLVLTPLMAFMISIMNSDRQEQAKATSEQEIQAAIDYISRDLQQAIYIYDNDGLSRNNSNTASLSGIRNQIPPGLPVTGCTAEANCKPILVFWKRKFIKDVIPAEDNTRDDTFVYSLVAYYIIKDSTPSSTWSPAARIARFEVSDGIQDADGVPCGSDYPNLEFLNADFCPNPGFKRFDLNLTNATGRKEKMNSWKKANTNYDLRETPFTVLVDYIDQTAPTVANPLPACTSGQRISSGYMGFYACVDAENTTAQVFLRGNSLARLQTNNITYNPSIRNYFPTGSIRVQGRGYLYTK